MGVGSESELPPRCSDRDILSADPRVGLTGVYFLWATSVAVADNRTMLAMKIRASRGRRDEPDLATLLQSCKVKSVEEALMLYDEYFPEDPPPKRARLILEQLLNLSTP
jgi:hypothetical protein